MGYVLGYVIKRLGSGIVGDLAGFASLIAVILSPVLWYHTRGKKMAPHYAVGLLIGFVTNLILSWLVMGWSPEDLVRRPYTDPLPPI